MRSRILVGLIAGTIGGLLGWFLQENLVPHKAFLDTITGRCLSEETSAGDMRTLAYCIGGLIGVFLGLVDGVTEGNSRKLGQGLLVGAIAGVFLGYVGLALGNAVFAALGGDNIPGSGLFSFTRQVIARSLGWAFMGCALGVGASLATRSPRRILHGAVGGLIGGFLGGFVFDMVGQSASVVGGVVGQDGCRDVGGPGRAIGFTAIGGLTGFFIGLVDELFKQAWVKILAGRNEGKDLILSKPMNILGKDERADVPLFGDTSVAPQHAAIRAERSRHILMDGGTQGGTVVNGQRVAQGGEVLLKDGDMIQIGTHRILFREKSTASKVSRPDSVDAPKSKPSIAPVPSHLCPFCGSPKKPDGSCLCSLSGGNTAPLPSLPPLPNNGGTAPLPPLNTFAPAVYVGAGAAMGTLGGAVQRLVGVEGPYIGQVFELTLPVMSVGREVTREIPLRLDNHTSRNHARISQENGVTILYDNNAANGTYVNNVRITQQTLVPGDVVQFGESKFRCE